MSATTGTELNSTVSGLSRPAAIGENQAATARQVPTAMPTTRPNSATPSVMPTLRR